MMMRYKFGFFALFVLWKLPESAAQAPIRLVASDSTVRYYLARALTLQGGAALPASERQALFRWAGTCGTRFAGRIGGFWFTPRSLREEQAVFDTTRRSVAELHALQPTMMVQGGLFEIVYPHVDSLPVPNRIRAAFGEDTLKVAHRRFRFAEMMYPGYFSPTNQDEAHYRWDSRPPGQTPGVPDMSRSETQLWFYYQAVRQIDAGCEALHFGQVMIMDNRDPGHHAWWSLLQRIRAYGRTRNRGVVLCDAHTRGEYYDPDPDKPLPDSLRQLLFDFHSFPMRPVEIDTVRKGTHGARLEMGDSHGEMYGRSKGGRTPWNTTCSHLPALVEFDNCGTAAAPGRPGQRPWVWGLDEISWFATQPSAYRDKWLVYAYARVRQLDTNVYLQFPGLRVVVSPPRPDYLYRADQTSQGDVIRACWAGETAAAAARMLLVGPRLPGDQDELN